MIMDSTDNDHKKTRQTVTVRLLPTLYDKYLIKKTVDPRKLEREIPIPFFHNCLLQKVCEANCEYYSASY